MASVAKGLEVLDGFQASVIDGANIDWQRWLRPEDKSRILPAESLAEKAKARLMLGAEQETGLSLPWDKTNGKVLIRPGKLVVWAGWTHHGKTQMVKQVMLHAIKQSERPLIASMEEDVSDVYTDMATMACGDPQPSIPQLERFNKFVAGKLWLYDQQGQVDGQRIQAVIRYAAAELKITQVVIDSLMMMAISRDDYEAQGTFVRQLHATAHDTGCTVHLVAHMRKRDGKGGDESPGTVHDIAGGHEIASAADTVFLPWRDKKNGTCQLKVDKQRGRINWLGTVMLNFNQRARQFVEDVHAMKFWSDEEPISF